MFSRDKVVARANGTLAGIIPATKARLLTPLLFTGP
jgi:hypothetical protein